MPRRRWILFGAGLAALTAAVALTTTMSSSPPAQHVVIRMDPDGFAPRQVEIRQGDTVMFVNTDQRPRWPASHLHPAHQIYPEFDPKTVVWPQQEWHFRFDKAGVWRFHDHLHPHLSGSISVKESAGLSPGRLLAKLRTVSTDAYAGTRARLTALYFRLFPHRLESALAQLNVRKAVAHEKELRHWLAVLGPDRVMAHLLKDSGGGSALDCHQQAHQVGRAAYELYGPEAFQKGDASCHSGYYHGAMEGFLKERGTRNLVSDIGELCRRFETRFGRFQCLHGVGHGVMAYEDYDLPRALDACGRLGTEYSRTSCYGGVFMENIVSAQGHGAMPGHQTQWVSQDPHFPCNGVSQDSPVQRQCYQMQTSWMLTLSRHDFDRVAAECLRARADMVAVCFRSLGRDAAGHTLRKPPEILTLCDKVMRISDHYDHCIAGALNVIVDFWGPSLRGQATELCTLVATPHKRGCYATLAGRLTDVFRTPGERTPVCQSFESSYRDLCSS